MNCWASKEHSLHAVSITDKACLNFLLTFKVRCRARSLASARSDTPSIFNYKPHESQAIDPEVFAGVSSIYQYGCVAISIVTTHSFR